MGMTPQIGSKGLFTLLDPYASKYAQYLKLGAECMGIRSIPDLINAGTDVLTEYYLDLNLIQAAYQTDLDNDVYIVNLKTPDGVWINIPASYITALPDSTGVLYTVTGIVVQLGALPDGLDFSYLKEKISEVVETIIGVSSTEITTLTLSASQLMSKGDHDTLEATRQSIIAGTTSDYARVKQLEDELTRVTKHNKALEAFILGGTGTIYRDGTAITVDMVTEYIESRNEHEL
jgi:hypothetical protein